MTINSFVLLNRKILEWEWYEDHKMFKLFLHCLVKANWRNKKWKGISIERSTFITSLGKLSDETGLTVKEVRGALDRLQKTGELKLNTPKKGKKGKPYTLVKVCNYNSYQSNKYLEGKPRAQEGHTEGTERATTNNINNINKEVIIIIEDAKKNSLQDSKWVSAIKKNFNLSDESFDVNIDEFTKHATMNGRSNLSVTEYQQYFLRWYKKKTGKNSRGMILSKHKKQYL